MKRIFVLSQNYLINIIWLKRHDNSGDRFSIIWVAIIIHHPRHKLLIVLVMRQMSLYYLGQTNEYRHKNSNMNGLLHHEQELDINVWGTCPVMATCGTSAICVNINCKKWQVTPVPIIHIIDIYIVHCLALLLHIFSVLLSNWPPGHTKTRFNFKIIFWRISMQQITILLIVVL